MKKLFFFGLILFFITFFCFSCDKVEPAAGNYWGEIKSDKNGKKWENYLFAGLYKYNAAFSLNFLRTDKFGQNREEIIISPLPFKVATYNFKEEDYANKTTYFNYSTWVSDGDIPGNAYALFENSKLPNRLEITKIDTITKEIWGKFSANLVVTERGETVSPDTVVFTNAVFHTKVLPF